MRIRAQKSAKTQISKTHKQYKKGKKISCTEEADTDEEGIEVGADKSP